MLRTLIVFVAACAALLAGLPSARADIPTIRAINELELEIIDRQKELGGALAAGTDEFIALRRARKALAKTSNKITTHMAPLIATAVKELEAVYPRDPEMSFLLEDLFDAYVAHYQTANIDGAREDIGVLPPSTLQNKALAKITKAEEAVIVELVKKAVG